MAQGVFRCGTHNFDSDPKKTIPEQEDEYYQHLRDEEHEATYSKRCQHCRKKQTGKMKGKVPQPYVNEDGKKIFPRSMIVFCKAPATCKADYAKNLGITL